MNNQFGNFLSTLLIDKVILTGITCLCVLVLFVPEQASISFLFLLKALINIAPYLLIAVALAAFIKASGLDNTVNKVFSGNPLKSILLASLFGAISPFCSCSVIPLIASLLAAGVPLAPVMAFWIASPVMDPEMFILTTAGIGLDFALAKAIFAILLGIFAGTVSWFVSINGWLGEFLRPTKKTNCSSGFDTDDSLQSDIYLKFWQQPKRLKAFKVEFKNITFFLGKWLAIAFLLESLMLAYIEPQWISQYMGGDDLWVIPLAALIGMPSYLNGYAAIPMVNALMELGMSQAAAMTFMLTGAVSSIPAMLAVFALVKLRAFVLYLMTGFIGAIILGYTYHFVIF